MASSSPLPEGLPLDTASWEQTPLVVQQVVVHLLAVIQQQAEQSRTLEARMAALEARVQQRSSNADRPPSSDPPYEKRPTSAGTQGRPGARPGHPGQHQALLAPTEVIEVMPGRCACGQREFSPTTPYSTHQVIELPEIRMAVTHVVWHEMRCPRCGRLRKAERPMPYRDG
jgi:transposase